MNYSRAVNNLGLNCSLTTATNVFWDVTPCSLVKIHLRFDRTSSKNGGNRFP